MITFIIDFYLETPVLAGILTGAAAFSAPLYGLGWLHGQETAMRKVRAWMQEKREASNVVTLPPARERRFSVVSHREGLL